MIHQFSTRKHRKVSTTSIFNVCKEVGKSQREYLARFNEEIYGHMTPHTRGGMNYGGLKNDSLKHYSFHIQSLKTFLIKMFE